MSTQTPDSAPVADSSTGTTGSEVTPSAQDGVKRIEGRTPLQLAWARLKRDRVAMASLVVVVILILMALLAPLLVKVLGIDPYSQDREHGLTPDGLPVKPSGDAFFGTDDLGRDILARIIYGARVSLAVGILATFIALFVGLVLGTVSGYFGGKTDTVISRTMDVLLGFPFLLTAIALVVVFGPSVKISVLVIAFFSWSTVGRVVRGQVLSLKEKEYVEAARSLGASDFRIMAIDIVPNLIGPLIVYGTLLVPVAIVFEATLSFLGLGVTPPTASWGSMLQDSVSYYEIAWWTLFFPGMALFITTLAFNLLGDGLRDALDPGSARTGAVGK